MRFLVFGFRGAVHRLSAIGEGPLLVTLKMAGVLVG